MCVVTGEWPIVGQRYFSIDSGIDISETGWKKYGYLVNEV